MRAIPDYVAQVLLSSSWEHTMSDELPVLYIARHGETPWSVTGQHTGLTDLPLTERGEQNARALRSRLDGLSFATVLTSPLQRAARTCDLAGFGPVVRSIPPCSNGTMASTRAVAPSRFMRNARGGICSATAVRAANRRTRSPRGPTARSIGCACAAAMCCSFPAAIFSACSPLDGSGLRRMPGATSC